MQILAEPNSRLITKRSEDVLLNSYIALDLETTGLHPDRDKIIEIGMIRVEQGKIVDQFQTLVQPHQPLSVLIKRLTGITDQMLEDAPEIEDVLPLALDFMGQTPVLGHNIAFDCNFMEAALGEKYFPVYYDTLELARVILPAASSHRLGDLCRQLQIPLEATHRALDDAIYAAKLYEELQKIIQSYDGQKLADLASLLKRADSFWASVVQKTSIGSFWLDSKPAKKIKAKPEEVIEATGDGWVDKNKLLNYFVPDGLLQKQMPAYELRLQQLKLTQRVAESLNENKVLVAEAGTGTGKSMAYLIPALEWAASGGERVLISTRTIPLQEQLWEKDLPFLQKVLQLPIPAALAKGRQNYLCLQKWHQALADSDNCSPQEALFYARILIWLDETSNGDRSQLNLFGVEPDIWAALCGDSETCLGSRCVWFKRHCFITKARKLTESARLIITNHSLLFADVKAEKRILPEYGPLIIDEAHHLEDAAVEQLGTMISRNDLGRWIFTVHRLLLSLKEVLPPSETEDWRALTSEAWEIRTELLKSWRSFFELLRNYFVKKELGESRIIRRLKLEMFYTDNFPQIEFENLVLNFQTLLRKLGGIQNLWQIWALKEEVWERRLPEIEQIVNLGLQKLGNLQTAFSCKDSEAVYWVEVIGENENANLILRSAPLKVADLIYECLFSELRPVVMTSATLTINNNFDYFCQSVGLNQIGVENLLLESFGSPFQFQKQSMLGVVRNLPGQGAEGNNDYVEALAEVLEEYIKIMGGRTLVLFTSHRLLKRMYVRLKESLEKEDICLLGHNIDGGRWRLVEDFKNSSRAVIFGASSFWEGVDIPGEALRCVIIVKLPFLSPGIPMVEARQEYLQEQNLNAFAEYSLPQAVLRLKQGFGRLIRTENDRGAVIILDERIVTKGYGRFFRNSLPIKNHLEGDVQTIAKELLKWV